MPRIFQRRGTRAALNALAASNGLAQSEIYFISDENRIAVGTSVSTYEVFAKVSEAGGGLSATAEVDFGQSSKFAKSIATVPGALVGQKVVASVSLDMPAGVSRDELECDPVTVSAFVSATNQVTLFASAQSRISRKRNINLVVI